MADSIEVRLRPALGHREGELTRCRPPLVSRGNSRYSSCTSCYSVGKPSGETACTASNRYLLIGPGALWREGVMAPCTQG